MPVRGCKYPRNCLFREFYMSPESRSVADQSLPKSNAIRPPGFVLGQYYGRGYLVREPHAWCRHGVYRVTYRVGVSVCPIYCLCNKTQTRGYVMTIRLLFTTTYVQCIHSICTTVTLQGYHFKQFVNSRDMYRVRAGLQSAFARV